MAFQFSNQGTPYYQPVAPELPGRVNIEQGERLGGSIINAFVQKAMADERGQLEQKRLLQQADLAAQQLAHQDKWQMMDHNIAQQNADSLNQYRETMASNYISAKATRDAAAAAKLAEKQAVDGLMNDYSTATSKLNERATTAATPLLNPENQQQRPAMVMRGIADWMTENGGAKVGAAPLLEQQLTKVAADLKVPYVEGAAFVNSKGGTTGEKNDALAWRVPSKPDKEGNILWQGVQPGLVQQKPLAEVAAMYNDPVNRTNVTNALIAAGHGSVAENTQTERIPWSLAKKTTKSLTPTLDPWANRLLLDLGAKQVQKGSHVPPALRHTPSAVRGMIKAGMTGGGEITGEGGDIEGERERANQAISANPAAEGAIRAYFEQKNGEPL